MILQELSLQGFRSYDQRVWQFPPGRNVVVAPNGSGKSNLLEAVRLLSLGNSWRTTTTDELIEWDQELARIAGTVQRLETEDSNGAVEADHLEVLLTHGTVQGRRTSKRVYKVNGVNRRKENLVGKLLTVQFVPEDMDIFVGSPGGRRRLVDEVLCQVSADYQRSLKTYEQALRRRNKLVLALRDGSTDRYAFFYWDQLLIEHGTVIHNWRARFLDWLNQQPPWQENYQLHYDHSVVSEARLHQYAQAEVGAGHTLVGPHLDDWQLQVHRGGQWRSIAHFGSRGEQRLALIWWKLGEVAYLQDYHHQEPVVLLDDILSELDGENGAFLFQHLQQQQCLITTTANHLPTLKDVVTNVMPLSLQ